MDLEKKILKEFYNEECVNIFLKNMEHNYNDDLKINDKCKFITEKDYYAYQISTNNILIKPNKCDRFYFENNNLYDSFEYFYNAVRLIKIPKNTLITKSEKYNHIECSNFIYLTTRQSPYTYPTCIFIRNDYENSFIIPNLNKVIDYVCSIDYSK